MVGEHPWDDADYDGCYSAASASRRACAGDAAADCLRALRTGLASTKTADYVMAKATGFFPGTRLGLKIPPSSP